MYEILLSLHSFLPYLFLIAIVPAIILFVVARLNGGEFKPLHRILALMSLIFAHLQLLIGLILYFISPMVKQAYASGEMMSNPDYRFFAVEHIFTMLVGIILITIGYSKAKRASTANGKFNRLIIFYLIGLILILAMIPWERWPA